jgi:hemoglobin-like flavoprotein
MSLTEEDVRIVKDSLPIIRTHLQPASMIFYENLFKVAPELRPMFREDLAGQGMKFFSTLNAIFDMLTEADMAQGEMTELSASHATLGVKPEHYPPMREALDRTLTETLGTDFSPEIRVAWLRAYDDVAAVMIRRAGL